MFLGKVNNLYMIIVARSKNKISKEKANELLRIIPSFLYRYLQAGFLGYLVAGFGDISFQLIYFLLFLEIVILKGEVLLF